jgi:hypothetical protein
VWFSLKPRRKVMRAMRVRTMRKRLVSRGGVERMGGVGVGDGQGRVGRIWSQGWNRTIGWMSKEKMGWI